MDSFEEHAGMRATGWRRRLGAALAGTVVAATGLVAGLAPAAHADSAPQDPNDPATPTTVTADGLPTAQIDGVVWSQAVVGNRVYAGGNFANARPAGSAPGTNLVPRQNLLAYDITTGDLIASFAPNLNGQVRTVAVSPDQSRVYVGGTFTSIDGQTRNRIAAFDAGTGALIGSFAPPVNYDVYSIVATDTTVYAGGDFQGVGTHDRGYLAAFNAANGALLDWAPQAAGGKVWALTLNPGATKIAVAGQFTTLNGSGNPGYGLGMVDATTGASLPMAINGPVRDAGTQAGITTLSSDGNNVYGGTYTFGAGGTLEGTFAASWNGGTTQWINDCHGDIYSIHQNGGAVYGVGHTHFCGNIEGFPQTDPDWTFYRGIAFGKAATGLNTRDFYGYGSFQGQPHSSLLTWYPSVNAGTFTGQNQGPWSVSGNSQYVVMAGEFTKVNNKAQQGLVRFPVKAISPNAQGPTLFNATYPLNVTSTESGKVRINWATNQDIDNDYLTYKVYRDVQLKTGLVYEASARANFWAPYTMGFTDSDLVPGSSHQYRVAVTDPSGNIANSPWTTVSVASAGADSSYVKAVYDSQPVNYWRLGETTGTAAKDTVGFTPVTTGAGVAHNTAGAIVGDADKAATFNGTSTGNAFSTKRMSPPNVFTVEGWFKTSTALGGKLIGFGDKQTGSSSNYDRQLYMDNAGHILFGVYNGATQVVTSPATYRNNQWHHVAATLNKQGMKLYVDGNLVASRTDVTFGQGAFWGYWRIGGDNLNSWPSKPLSNNFSGSLDEIAIYNRELTAAEISAHRTAGIGANVAPTASFTAAITDQTLNVDGSASTDIDGTIDSYSWDFGDSATATGVTASHTYAAAGTYTVKLTVTDDDGAISSVTQQVVATPPNVAPTASFTTSTSDLLVNVDGTGSTDSDGTISSYAWDFGDGGSGTGATASHTYAAGGTFNVKLTVTDDDGATGTVTKQVVATPPNVAPTASFTSTANHLLVNVDGTGSTDSDGTISSYAWDFGDGGSGTGATASHTYAVSGTYNVKLTVTDDDGATGTVTKQVVASSAALPFALDAFERSVTSNWGNADLGGLWTKSGSATNFNVAGGVGTIRMGSAGAGPGIALNSVSSSDSEVRVAAGLDKVPTGGGTFLTVKPRILPSGDSYYLDTRMLADGSVTVTLGKQVGTAQTSLQTKVVAGLTMATGDRLSIRVQANGTSSTTFRAKVWKVGATEPADWVVSASDATAALQGSGSVGLSTYLTASSTNAPVVASFDDFWAGPTG